jgi:hypothetical protein
MKRRIKLTTRRELTEAVRQRYQVADRRGKRLILDEFTKVAGYHRKHAIRILTTQSTSEPKTRAAQGLLRGSEGSVDRALGGI